MMKKEVWVQFSEEANTSYTLLQEQALKEKGNQQSIAFQLLTSIERIIQTLKIDPHHGTHIPRKNIPQTLIKRYGTDRLWKIDLVGYWRLIYTLTGDEVKIITFILEFMNHKEYDKRFGYKKK